VSLCVGERESDRLSDRSSGSVFLSAAADKSSSLLSSLFHPQSQEPDVIHRSIVGQKLADCVPPRNTSPVAADHSQLWPVERTQLGDTSRPLSANVGTHAFGTPALVHRVSSI